MLVRPSLTAAASDMVTLDASELEANGSKHASNLILASILPVI